MTKMDISKIYKWTTEEVVVRFNQEPYIPFSMGGYNQYVMTHVTLRKKTTENGTRYSWEGSCRGSTYDSLRVFHDGYAYKDIEFAPIREAFEKLGWDYPENPHNGKPDYL